MTCDRSDQGAQDVDDDDVVDDDGPDDAARLRRLLLLAAGIPTVATCGDGDAGPTATATTTAATVDTFAYGRQQQQLRHVGPRHRFDEREEEQMADAVHDMDLMVASLAVKQAVSDVLIVFDG